MGGHDQVYSGGANFLRQPLDRRLDLLTSDQHQVSHLIDHDDDQGQFAGVEGLRLKNRLAGLRIKPRLYLADQAFAFRLGFSQAGVEPVDIAYPEL